MELINGRTLEEIVVSGGPLGAPEASLVGLDCCRALSAIHKAGLIHRDLKPRNVMRERGGRIIVMDLGAARLRGPTDGETTTPAPPDLVGTPLYLAPEIFAENQPRSAVTSTVSASCSISSSPAPRRSPGRMRPKSPRITPIMNDSRCARATGSAGRVHHRGPARTPPEPQARFASAAAFAEHLTRVGAVRVLAGADDEDEVRARRGRGPLSHEA